MKDQFGISERLRELRGSLSQKDFADKIGISLRAYQWYESGRRIPPQNVLEKISSCEQVPLEYLLKGHFGLREFFYEGKANRKKTKNRREAELLTAALLPYVERHPRLFDRFKRILEEGNWRSIDAVTAVLRSLDPEERKTERDNG